MKKILTQQDMKDLNLNSILRLIRREGPVTRRQIAAALDLSWGAVSGATATLLQGGYVKEVAAPEVAGAGRTPTALVINQDDHFLLGLDVNRTGLSGVVTDQCGNVVHSLSAESTAADRDAQITEIRELIDRLLELCGDRSVLAIGLAMQGAVDSANGISASFPTTGWRDVPLAQILTEAYHIPTFLGHDPDCILYAASAEQALKDAILLRVDKGIGMAVMLDGKLFQRFGAFELGFTGSGTASLNDLITTEGLAHAAGVPFEQLVADAKAGNKAALALFDRLAEALGETMVNMMHIFHVDRFILCGKMLAHHALFRQRLTAVTEQRSPRRVLHTDITDVGKAAVGAALLAAARHEIKFE